MNLGVKFLLLVRQDEHLNVRVGSTSRIHGEEVRSLKDAHCQLWREERARLGSKVTGLEFKINLSRLSNLERISVICDTYSMYTLT